MDYVIVSIIAVQALLALILWLQNRHINAMEILVNTSLLDMIHRGVVEVIEDEENEDGQY